MRRPEATAGLLPVALLAALLLGHQQHQQQRVVRADSTCNSNNNNNNNNNEANYTSSRLVAGAGGYLLAQPVGRPSSPELRQLDLRLERKLEAVGPDLRQLRDYTQDDDTDLPLAKRAWQLMHEHARMAISSRLELLQPHLMQALAQANVSQSCQAAAESTLEAGKQLDSWALQVLSAWGNFPPSGIFEGTFGDIGSYFGCLNAPQNKVIGHAHYCTLSFRPLLPARRDFELIMRKEPARLLEMFAANATGAPQQAEDAFTELLRNAQYNHYIYYKLGACFPIQCSPRDVQRLARLLGRRSTLLTGPVKCYSKFAQDYDEPDEASNSSDTRLVISSRNLNNGVYIWKPHLTLTQRYALLVVGAISALVLVASSLDVALNYVPKLARLLEQAKESQQHVHVAGTETTATIMITTNLSDLNNNLGQQEDSSMMEMLAKAVGCPPSSAIQVGSQASGRPNSARSSREQPAAERSLAKELISDYSLVANLREFVRVKQRQAKSDISCIDGLRCVTMSWIIVAHTMQYNDWSAFARTREVETHLSSLINQPIFNATYLVDTFFLVSGLLTAYTSLKLPVSERVGGPSASRRAYERFSARAYLVGRYLRLTPQVLFVSLLFMLLPLVSQTGGPHWYTMTGEYSENCQRNWWINLLHIQAIYKPDEMCNFVCWWISVDMFYHIIALVLIVVILRCHSHRSALLVCCISGGVHAALQASKHYQLALPPNLLSTIPQTGAMWTRMTLEYYWTPYAHAFPFFVGFYAGYLLAQHEAQLASWFNFRRALAGWLLAVGSLLCQSYSTYFWVIGKYRYTQLVSTLFYMMCTLNWSLCLTWIIVACKLGYGSFVDAALSCQLFAVLSKASFLVYLSHFLVLFSFFGSQSLLLEPSQLVMLYIMIGNVVLSMLLGSLLCVAFEMPWLKTQRRIMRRIR